MTLSQTEKLLSLNVNIPETMERFIGNEALYFKCLGKFIDDKNYSLLKEAIANSNAKNAFEAAHALKGVSANLGLDSLYKEVAVITEVFRGQSMDFEPENLNRIDYEYDKIIKTLSDI